jgi:hypothetical protein
MKEEVRGGKEMGRDERNPACVKDGPFFLGEPRENK